jgi:hypothetical protein
MIAWNNLSVLFDPPRLGVCINPSRSMGGLFSCERQTTGAQKYNVHRSYRRLLRNAMLSLQRGTMASISSDLGKSRQLKSLACQTPRSLVVASRCSIKAQSSTIACGIGAVRQAPGRLQGNNYGWRLWLRSCCGHYRGYTLVPPRSLFRVWQCRHRAW